MKYLLLALILMYVFELSYYLYTEKVKNSSNKYFCKSVSERIGNSLDERKQISYDNFNVVVRNKLFCLYLDKNFIAHWTYENGNVTDLFVSSEELFKTFKEKYILENN